MKSDPAQLPAESTGERHPPEMVFERPKSSSNTRSATDPIIESFVRFAKNGRKNAIPPRKKFDRTACQAGLVRALNLKTPSLSTIAQSWYERLLRKIDAKSQERVRIETFEKLIEALKQLN